MGRPGSTVACLIVRDEQERLPGCLASLVGLTGVLVYDTGSTDDTVAVARAGGAHVVIGTWTDDFAAARNAALASARDWYDANWVLSVDADEQLELTGGVEVLTADDTVDAYTVPIENLREEGSYVHHAVRLFRADRCHWSGAVHERVVPNEPRDLVVRSAHASRLRLVHHGYITVEIERQKGLRNARLAQAALDAGEGDQVPVRLDLARSLLSAGSDQEALDTFLAVRDSSPHGSRPWRSATDFVTRMLLAAGEHELALGLAEDLRSGGAEPAYCDWLAAQAVVHLGDPAQAWRLLAPLQQVTDTDGRELGPARLHEMQALAAALVGEHARAAELIITAIADDGRLGPRLDLARSIWAGAGRTEAELEQELLDRVRPGQRAAIAAQLG
jgi:hypothetical protein